MGGQNSVSFRRLLVIGFALSLWVGLGSPDDGMAQPKGQMIIAVDFSVAPTFLNPAESPTMGTPDVFLYASHDALINPLPGNAMAPSPAVSWAGSADGMSDRVQIVPGLDIPLRQPLDGRRCEV